MFFKKQKSFVEDYTPEICRIPHFPVEQGTYMEGWLKEISPYTNYKRYSQNCRNCGASEIKNGNCAYCSTQY